MIEYRRKKEELVDELSIIPLPNKYGDFKLRLFEDRIHGDHHVALVKGDIQGEEVTLVRVHSQCLTGDIFGSLRCDCGEQLDGALNRIEKEGKGILVYLNFKMMVWILSKRMKNWVMLQIYGNMELGLKY